MPDNTIQRQQTVFIGGWKQGQMITHNGRNAHVVSIFYQHNYQNPKKVPIMYDDEEKVRLVDWKTVGKRRSIVLVP